jgi:hypothetical protein
VLLLPLPLPLENKVKVKLLGLMGGGGNIPHSSTLFLIYTKSITPQKRP